MFVRRITFSAISRLHCLYVLCWSLLHAPCTFLSLSNKESWQIDHIWDLFWTFFDLTKRLLEHRRLFFRDRLSAMWPCNSQDFCEIYFDGDVLTSSSVWDFVRHINHLPLAQWADSAAVLWMLCCSVDEKEAYVLASGKCLCPTDPLFALRWWTLERPALCPWPDASCFPVLL